MNCQFLNHILFCIMTAMLWSSATGVGAVDPVDGGACGDPPDSSGENPTQRPGVRSVEADGMTGDRVAAKIGQKIFMDSGLSRPVGQATAIWSGACRADSRSRSAILTEMLI